MPGAEHRAQDESEEGQYYGRLAASNGVQRARGAGASELHAEPEKKGAHDDADAEWGYVPGRLDPKSPTPAESIGAKITLATASISMCALSPVPCPTATSCRKAEVNPKRA